MEYKTLSRGEGGGSAVKKRAKAPARAKPKLAAKTVHRPTADASWGAVYLDATEFAELEECIQTPQKPTQSILKGAELIRSLYRKSR
jgi:hypothetical protein